MCVVVAVVVVVVVVTDALGLEVELVDRNLRTGGLRGLVKPRPCEGPAVDQSARWVLVLWKLVGGPVWLEDLVRRYVKWPG